MCKLFLRSWKWTKLDDMKYGRFRHNCGVVGEGYLVVAGGFGHTDYM